MLQDQFDANTGGLLEVLGTDGPDWKLVGVEIQTTMACWWDSCLMLQWSPFEVSWTLTSNQIKDVLGSASCGYL